jgi:hypothetical protein
MARERVERCSKGMKEVSQDDEVGSKRPRQQAKQARASKPGPSPPSPPWKGFKMLLTAEISDSDEEEDYPEQDVRATYAKAKFALIRPIMKGQAVQVQMEIKPKPIMVREGQVITRTRSTFNQLSDRYNGKR